VRPGEKAEIVRTYVVPIALMFVMFMIIFTGVPQLMTAVVQEKLSKISEVLIGSVSSFDLMMGKLLGSAGGALVLSLVYVGGGYAFAAYSGYADALPLAQLAYFVLFMVLAVLLYGSVFIAIGRRAATSRTRRP
jgi:ABC-2 type transport system permease protein